MGAGFYDRALQRRRARDRTWKRPLLVGVGIGLIVVGVKKRKQAGPGAEA